MNKIDVVLGLQYGDEGKGKITNQMAKSGKYNVVLRYNGGSNAGHTIFVNGEKIVTHLVPCGIFHNIESIIGSGCVVHVDKLMNELEYLSSKGFNTSLVKVAYNAHIVTDKHIKEDSKDTKIGTTKTGNGPCYRDKVMRTGKRAENIPSLKSMLVDIADHGEDNKILAEGAQGYWLDIDNGDYPYVTSSSCGVGAVINNGFSHKSINMVVGVAKAYSTYVGAKAYQSDDPRFDKIREIGLEFGATTGRPRQIQWFDVDEVLVSCIRNGVDKLIINKLDVLEQVENSWNVMSPSSSIDKIMNLGSKDRFKEFIIEECHKTLPKMSVEFQESPL